MKQKYLDSSIGKVQITEVGVEFELPGSNPTISLVIFQKFRYFNFLSAAVLIIENCRIYAS